MTSFTNVVPGMAFFPGTGPADKTCARCEEFLGKPRRSGIGKGEMQAGRCAKYVAMSRNANGGRAATFNIPPDTKSCKYFRPAIYGPPTTK